MPDETNIAELMLIVEEILAGGVPEATTAKMRFAFQVYTAKQLKNLNGTVKENRDRIAALERDARISYWLARVLAAAILVDFAGRLLKLL